MPLLLPPVPIGPRSGFTAISGRMITVKGESQIFVLGCNLEFGTRWVNLRNATVPQSFFAFETPPPPNQVSIFSLSVIRDLAANAKETPRLQKQYGHLMIALTADIEAWRQGNPDAAPFPVVRLSAGAFFLSCLLIEPFSLRLSNSFLTVRDGP